MDPEELNGENNDEQMRLLEIPKNRDRQSLQDSYSYNSNESL